MRWLLHDLGFPSTTNGEFKNSRSRSGGWGDNLAPRVTPDEILAEHLLARLRGAEAPPPPDDLEDLAAAHLDLLDERAANALALERARVQLEGSTLDLDDAERTLARKEERRLFPPLRDRIAGALRPFLDVERDAANRLVDDLELEEESDPRLDALVARLREPAAVALEVLGGELPRALDPVCPAGGYAEAAARALVRAARDASPEVRRPLTRVRAPRALAGHVVTRARGPARALWSPALRGARFSRLLEGSATALVAALIGEGTDHGDVAAAILGSALASGLSGAVVRKAVTDDSRAREHERELRARAVLETFLVAATARAPGEETRELVASALGADFDPWCALPWPGFGPLAGPRAATGGRALRTAHGAALHAALREQFDEAFPIVPPVLERLRTAGRALASGALSIFALFEIEPEDDPGQALVDGLHETL
jgi:hypothetical protein